MIFSGGNVVEGKLLIVFYAGLGLDGPQEISVVNEVLDRDVTKMSVSPFLESAGLSPNDAEMSLVGFSWTCLLSENAGVQEKNGGRL